MFSTEDTIVAIATPPGRGGIGVVRISGSRAAALAAAVIPRPVALAPRQATFVVVHVPDTRTPTGVRPLDQAVAILFPAPHSYTGDDVVEISTHGSPVILRSLVEALVHAGARLAGPGEFTLRAFLNRRIDLPQAEAVADLIDAVTPLQAAAAFDQLQGTLTRSIAEIDAELFDLIARLEANVDFPDEGYHFVAPGAVREALVRIDGRMTALLARGRRGRVIREGRTVAIVGGPNVGKSSLFNALVGSARAIVTEVPGTTRDLVSETVDLDGLRITVVDTAGVRDTTDLVEGEGIARSAGAARVADLIVVVRDGSVDVEAPRLQANAQIVADNKADKADYRCRPGAIAVSALTGEGLPDLRRAITTELTADDYDESPEISNVRHLSLMVRSHEAVERAIVALDRSDGTLSEEFVLADLQDARSALEEITGQRTADDVLGHIFGRFCVGK